MKSYLIRKWAIFCTLTLSVLSFALPQIGYGTDMKVKIGYHPAMCLSAIYIAKDKNLFQKAGINAQIIEYQGGPPMIPAFRSKEIDIGFLGGPPAISAMDKGVDVSIYGFAHMEGSAIIVRTDAPYKKVEDLKGKLIAVPVFGSIQDVLTRITLKMHGLEPVKDVKLMEAGELGGVGQLPTLLKKGDVDAYVAWPPFNEIPLIKGFGRPLLKPEEMVPHNPCCVIAARNAFVRNNPRIFEKIMRITRDASIFSLAYPEEAAISIKNVVGYDEELAKYSLKFAGNYCALPSPEGVATTMKILKDMKDLGYIKNNLSEERVFNLKYAKAIHPEPPHQPGKIGPQPEIYKRVMGKAPQ
ncbi:MAG: ABC transporter substrate-binding protein [Desulfobacterales bacterium]